MALNLDTAIRVVAKVAGLNEFQSLTDSLGKVQSTAEASAAGLQQTAAGSARTAQEAARAATASRAQSTALQELQAKSRSSAAELQRMGVESRQLELSLGQAGARVGQALGQMANGATGATNKIKEFQLALQPTEDQVSRLRDQVLQFGETNTRTERSIKQQIDALKNLRSQAEINGSLYQQLTADIERITNASKGMDAAMQSAVDELLKVQSTTEASTTAIKEQIKSLERLQTAFVEGSDDYVKAAKSIDQLQQKLIELTAETNPVARGFQGMARAMFDSIAKQETAAGKLRATLDVTANGYKAIGQQIDDLKRKAEGLDLSKVGGTVNAVRTATGTVGNIVQLRKQLAQSMAGRVVLTGEGLATAGLAGGAAAGAGAALGEMATGVGQIQAGVDAMANFVRMAPVVGEKMAAPITQSAEAIADFASKIASTQAHLADLSAPFQAVTHAIQSIGPEAAAVAGAVSLAFASIYPAVAPKIKALQDDLRIGYKGISDEVQKMLVETSKIVVSPAFRQSALEDLKRSGLQRLGQAAPDSEEARRAANTVAVAEREIAKIKGEQNQLLEQARARQEAGSEALKSQVQIARDRLEVQRKLTAEIKASAEEDRQARQIAGAIRRNEERTRPQREAEAEAAARTQGLIEQAKQRLQIGRAHV